MGGLNFNHLSADMQTLIIMQMMVSGETDTTRALSLSLCYVFGHKGRNRFGFIECSCCGLIVAE